MTTFLTSPLEELSHAYSVPLATVREALHKLSTGEVYFLGVSGRIGAGKDTVAPELMRALGYEDCHQESYAAPLRLEVNEVINIIVKAPDLSTAVKTVAAEMNASNVEVAVEALYDVVKKREVRDSFQRTVEVRRALQWWGTEVRRQEDVNYWVKKAINSSLELLANGVSIYVTDMRFPNEADAVLAFQGKIVRLEVSPEEQAKRIQQRDGKPPTEEAINHASEKAMNDYAFPFTINTDVYGPTEVVKIALESLK